jgi:3-hydroxyisobutyrate dehydrogenase
MLSITKSCYALRFGQEAQTMQLGFIGLGVMGGAMAGHLAKAGHEVTVFNRSRDKAERWAKEHGGKVAASPAEAARGAEVVFTCVGNDDDLRQVVAGEHGAFSTLAKDGAVVDHTTTSAVVARELETAARARGLHFLDAPVSGGQVGAETGKLTMMVGGDPAAFAKVRPLVACYTRSVELMGPAGSGQLTKMANQIMLAGVVEGLAEGLAFATRAGLDVLQVIDVVSKGGAQSWQMDNRAKTMVAGKFDFGFAVDWMRKDLAICFAEAQRNGASLPVTALVDQLYARVQARGGGRLDTSSLIDPLVHP